MTPTLLGKSTARPETRAVPKSCGTIRVVWGARPRRNPKISANDSADDTVWVCDWSGRCTFVAPTTARAGSPSPQIASVGTPPGGEVAVRPSRLT